VTASDHTPAVQFPRASVPLRRRVPAGETGTQADSDPARHGTGSDAPVAPDVYRRRVLISTTSVLSSNLLVALLGTISLRLMTTRLGPSQYGDFVASISFVASAMLLADLGVNAITGREIAKRPDRAASILGHNLGLRLTLSVVFVPIVSFLGLLAYSDSNANLRYCVVIAACAVPFDALRSVCLGYFVAGVRNHVTAVISLVQQVLFVGLIIVALWLGWDVIACVYAYLVATAITGVMTFIVTRRNVRFGPRFNLKRWRTIVAQSFSIGIIQIVNLLYLKADLIILSIMSTSSNVGIYGVAYAVINFFLLVPSIFMTSLLPAMTTATEANLGKIVDRAIRYLAAAGVLVATGTLCFGSQVVRVLAGEKFAGASVPLSILAVSCVFSYLNAALGFASVARNRHHKMVVVSVVGLAVNVMMNVIVIPVYGIDGAATAYLVSELVTLCGVYLVFRRDVGLRIPLGRILARPAVVGMLCILVFRVGLSSASRGLVVTAALAAGQVVLYVGVLSMLGGIPDEWQQMVENIKRRVTVVRRS
jgi:O-antigen/teichoic acid export membrane protein